MDFYTSVERWGNNILVRGYKDGKRYEKRVRYQPYVFIPCDKPTEFRTLDGLNVMKYQFESISDVRSFVERHKADNFHIYGLDSWQHVYINDTYKGEVQYDRSVVSVVSLDIEVSTDGGFPSPQLAENPITAITMSRNGQMVTLGLGDFTCDRSDLDYYKCADEYSLLKTFLSLWASPSFSPDVVTGWNIDFFDIPYLVNRIARILGEDEVKKLSPWGSVQADQVEVMGRTNQVFRILGIVQLDYLQLYRKFTYSELEQYTLDHVASVELGEKKLDLGQYKSIQEMYEKDYQRFISYNIVDVELIDRLDQKLKLIDLVMAIAYSGKINYKDTFTTVRPWDVRIHNYLLDKGIVVPPFEIKETRSISGGYVKDPLVGMHKWVVSLDLTSLYPSIIMQYNISPETFRGKLKAATHITTDGIIDGQLDQYNDWLVEKDYTVTANLCLFDRSEQGFLPALMSRLYQERDAYKKQMLKHQSQLESVSDKTSKEAVELSNLVSKFDNLQKAIKIVLNSGYGALANKAFRWNKADHAEAITTCGQLTTRWIEKDLNVYLNKMLKTTDVDYVIACDTDSVYLTLEALVSKVFNDDVPETPTVIKFLDKFCIENLKPFINKSYDRLFRTVNGRIQKMDMKRECIADLGLWTGKKRYILNVYNSEGVNYAEPKLKMMGIEAIRSSTPHVCRDAIKKSLALVMTGDQQLFQQFIQQFRDEFNSMSFEQVAFPRSVSNLDDYRCPSNVWKKSTPIHVKGALIYNDKLDKLGISKQYPLIRGGEKIKFAYLQQPNPLHSPVIASPASLPSEFGIDQYVDRAKQFDKAFLGPLTTISDAIGWTVEVKSTLEDFFV